MDNRLGLSLVLFSQSLWAAKRIHSASAFCSFDIRFIACQLKYLSNIKLAVAFWKQRNAKKYFSWRTQNNLQHVLQRQVQNMLVNYKKETKWSADRMLRC